MDIENKDQVITKQKNEGRVRAGKQLSEWNKKNKENLLKNKTQDNSSEKASNLSSAPSYLSSKYYYGGAGIVLVAGIAILYFWNQKPEKTPPPAPPTKPKISDEEFYKMN